MFNVEKLLGKIVGEVIGGSGQKGSGLSSSLSSGTGLMTLIGLGVGAVEIFKDQQKQKPKSTPPPPAPSSAPSPAAPPPIPPPLPGGNLSQPKTIEGDELARRMIQVMIAAAHADGVMDDDEKQEILSKLEKQGLDDEEKSFLLTEMGSPLSMSALTAGIHDDSAGRTMYMLAAATITIDTGAERKWMDTLAEELSIGKEIKEFIEEQQGIK